MKIILLSNSIEPNSGFGTMTHHHALFLYKKDIDFELLLPKEAQRFNVPYADKIKYVLPNLPSSFAIKGLFNNLPKSLMHIKAIQKIFFLWKKIPIDDKRISLVHSLIDFPYAFLAYRLAKKLNCPFIFTGHGTYSVAPFSKFPDRQIMMKLYKKASAIIVISNFTAKKMKEISGHQRDIDVIYNPISEPASVKDSESQIISNDDILDNSKVILSIGPLKSRKGGDILIQALPEIVNKIPEAQLVIVGNGDKDKYYQLAESLGVRKNLLILQNIPAGELIYLLKRCSVFALTSRYVNHNFEGYGLVYLEAGLYKKPVVAADSGGVSDAVHHQETGLLVPEDNIEATADALVKILSNEELAQKLGEGNYRLAKERNWDDYIDQVIKIYRSVAKDQGEHA